MFQGWFVMTNSLKSSRFGQIDLNMTRSITKPNIRLKKPLRNPTTLQSKLFESKESRANGIKP
jgi:hypothetical protein